MKRYPGQSVQTEKRRIALGAKRPRKPLGEVERILVKMPNWLGDAVMSLPAIEHLRRLFPHAWIACLIKGNLADLLRNNDAVNAVIKYHHGQGVVALNRKVETIRRLRRKSFDLAVLLTNSFESALWMYSAGIPLRVGYNTAGRGLLLTHPVRPKPSSVHQIRYYIGLCKAIGEAGDFSAPRVRIPSREKEWADDFLGSIGFATDDLLAGLCPGAAYGSAKRWLPGRFIEVSRRICENYHAKCVVFGGKEDAEPCALVADGIGQAAINLCQKTTLKEFAALVGKCALVLSNDSGAMHLAAAIGTHVIAIFGSTDPARSAPPENCTVIKKDLPCSPCSKRECPTDHRCMTSISAEEVYQEAAKILRTKTAGRLRRRKARWMP